MDKFLEIYNLPRLVQEEIENMNKPITSNKIESLIIILKTPLNESSGPDGFTGEFWQTLKEELITFLLKLLQKIQGGELFKHILKDQYYLNNKIRQGY